MFVWASTHQPPTQELPEDCSTDITFTGWDQETHQPPPSWKGDALLWASIQREHIV